MDKAVAARVYTPAALEALQAFPIDSTELELVSVSENVTFRVRDASDGTTYVLRLHRPGYHSLDELIAERVWIRALGDAGIAVPPPLAASDGREYVECADRRHRRATLRGCRALDRGHRAGRRAAAY